MLAQPSTIANILPVRVEYYNSVGECPSECTSEHIYGVVSSDAGFIKEAFEIASGMARLVEDCLADPDYELCGGDMPSEVAS